MEFALLVSILLAILILWNQGKILRRLPAQTSRATMPMQHIAGEAWNLTGRIQSLEEGSFEIGFADYWTLGRVFTVHLEVSESENVSELRFDRLGVKVFPTGEGFDGEAFGRCTIVSAEYRSAVMHLPERVARNLLDEIRREEKQTMYLRGVVEGKTRLITHLDVIA